MRTIASFQELSALVGQTLAVSEWKTVTQEQIDEFGRATGDTQWIHTDIVRARKESPFGTTIAHGFLTLSLIPAMIGESISFPPDAMALNYGVNKVRFPAPVPSGSRIRGHIAIAGMESVGKGTQIAWLVSVEREGGDKPVCVAELLTRHGG